MIDITEKQRLEALAILDRIDALLKEQQQRLENVLRLLDDASKPKKENDDVAS